MEEGCHCVGFELGEHLRDGDLDGGAGHGELVADLGEGTLHGGEGGAAAAGVDDPNGEDANCEVVVHGLLDFAHAVVAKEDLDAEDGRGADDRLHGEVAAHDAEASDAVMAGGGLDTVLRQRDHMPDVEIQTEK